MIQVWVYGLRWHEKELEHKNPVPEMLTRKWWWPKTITDKIQHKSTSYGSSSQNDTDNRGNGN